jgi:uncharacterized protein YjeT (DUF2065 family)
MWRDILVALALVLVFEGILPFLDPTAWRRTALRAAQLNDRTLRLAGLGSMLVGLVLLHLSR